MESNVVFDLGFVRHVIKSIKNDDKNQLNYIRQQMENRAHNVENNVKIRHGSLVPLIYETDDR